MYDAAESPYASGGYYLARPLQHGPHASVKLIPERIISASSCFCEFFPGAWAIRWSSDDRDQRERSAAVFGIPAAKIDGVVEWATTSFQKVIGWPNTFYTIDAALAAHAEFLAKDLDVNVFGLGLHRDDMERFLREAEPEEKKPGYSQTGETGIYQCLKTQSRIAPGGQHVGFELLAMMFGLLTCSWLCNGLEAVCAEQLQVQPNEYGLISEYADARRCAEYVSGDEVGAEPGLWLPWLITRYSA
jgi:hypothetical protein